MRSFIQITYRSKLIGALLFAAFLQLEIYWIYQSSKFPYIVPYMDIISQNIISSAGIHFPASDQYATGSPIIIMPSSLRLTLRCGVGLAEDLLDQDRFVQQVQLVGDKDVMRQNVLTHVGRSFHQGKHILRLLYYRALQNLLRGTPPPSGRGLSLARGDFCKKHPLNPC